MLPMVLQQTMKIFIALVMKQRIMRIYMEQIGAALLLHGTI